MHQQTPIAVFAYNRPEHTERALASLAQCRRLDECRLVFYADGARSPAQADAVAATRRVLHAWAARLIAEAVERSENHGLAGSIAASVTDLCARHGRVIVVEDKLRVILGAGNTVQRNWISTNCPMLYITDARTFDALFAPESVRNFFAECVWEHLSSGDGLKAAGNCVKYLRSGGRLRIVVPDGFHPNPEYLAEFKPGGYGPGAADHKVLYDYRTITRMLEKAGYVVDLLEWFDENGQFHQINWDIADRTVYLSPERPCPPGSRCVGRVTPTRGESTYLPKKPVTNKPSHF